MVTFPHPYTRLTDDAYQTLQARLLVTGPHAEIAAHLGCHPATIGKWSNGTRLIPAHRLFVVSAIQRNWRFAQLLAEHAGALLWPFRPAKAHWTTLQLIAQTVIGFGRFLSLAEQVQDGAPLTDEEQRELEQAGQEIKDGVDALIQKAREQRARKHTVKE